MALRKKGRVVYGGHRDPVRYFIDDVEVPKAEYDAKFPSKFEAMIEAEAAPDGHRPAIWPMYSEAFACHPSQVEAMNQVARDNGIGARYQTGTGVCEIDSDGDKVKLARVEGFKNKQAGFR